MKISEIISEGKLRQSFTDATPGLETWPALNNNNSPYMAYRFGVALAPAPDRTVDKSGPIGGDFTTIGYSDADDEILAAAAKNMGVKSVKKSSDGSKESDWVNKSSPVQARGPVTLKKKK